MERQQVGLADGGYRDLEANEETSLIGRDPTSTDSQFIPLLERELRKICLFYESQEKELADDVQELQNLIQQQEDIGPDGSHQYSDGEHSEDEEDEDDDFDIDALSSPTTSRGDTLARSATSGRRRRRSRSEGAGGAATSGKSCRFVDVLFTKPSLEPARRRALGRAQRRYSISSSEDHGDLEASLVSLRSSDHPGGSLAAPSAGTGRGGSTSRSPMRTAKNLANRIFMKDSVTSNNFPVPDTIWTAKSNYAWDVQLLFKRRITNLYLTATSLRAYVELNYSGFRKILKKYVFISPPLFPLLFLQMFTSLC